MNQNKATIAKGVDWMMIWMYIALVATGLIAIFTVEYKLGDEVISTFLGFKKEYSKQFYFALASSLLGCFILLTDSKVFTAMANISYVG